MNYITNKELIESFWSNVDKRSSDECWNYKGVLSPQGYGQFWDGYKQIGAHRCAWEFSNKCKIPRGILIRHKCDNPSCVNPSHLCLGTYVDNMNDKMKRNLEFRSKIAFTLAKFTARQIQGIRKLLELKIRYKRIARIFKTCPSTISKIRRTGRYPCKDGFYI